LLRFEDGIDFDTLLRTIAAKLGVVVGAEDDYGLYLGGDALVEDTNEIDDGDDLVLRRKKCGGSSRVKKEGEVKDGHATGSAAAAAQHHPRRNDGISSRSSSSSSSSSRVRKEEEEADDDDDATTTGRRRRENGAENEDPFRYVGRRFARYIYVPGYNDRKLFFGRVSTYYYRRKSFWEVTYDDGDVASGLLRKDVEVGIRLAEVMRDLDDGGGKKRKKIDEAEEESDEDDDDVSVEDVTEQVLTERWKRMEKELIDIDDDDDDEEERSELEDVDYERDDEEDYESAADDLSYASNDAANTKEMDDEERRNDKKTKNTTSRKKRARKVKDPPLQVLMKEHDIPAAPGKRDDGGCDENDGDDGMEEISTLASSSGVNNKVDQAAKDRIIKLLNTGFHNNSNEHEARNAMKLAQRLMRRHNLSQAALLQERDAAKGGSEEVLKGGLVEVRIVNRKTQKPSQFARWISVLTFPISKNFDVESFHEVSRGRKCSVSFYGIYTNCQLAAYAFAVAVERISQMAAEYQPAKKPLRFSWQMNNTKSSRISYALGIVRGIDQEVDETIRREKERRMRKLERARQAVSKGEAYEESDNEDENDSTDGPGFLFPDAASGPEGNVERNVSPVSSAHNKNGQEKDSNLFGKKGGVASAGGFGEKTDGNTFSGAAAAAPPASEAVPPPLSGDALSRRLEELEAEEKTSLVLVDHREKVAEEVLKERDIKLSTGRKHKPIAFDSASYRKGIEDSKEIDINQRAIRDEVKIKKEKR